MFVTELPSDQQRKGSAVHRPVPPLPTRVLEIELSQPLPLIMAFDQETQVRYMRVFCLIRFHTQPLGILHFPLQSDALLPEDYAPWIWHTFQHALLHHLEQDGLAPIDGIPVEGLPSHELPRCIAERERFLADAPLVSVIVTTRDRPESLARCLDALVQLHYPHYEIIIVDNAPATQATADLVQKTYQHVSNLRYVCEERPGISYARNRGMCEARGEILAFTDDDVVVDTYWLAQGAKAFEQSSEIVCVTGYTLPLELNTPAQLWFEELLEEGEINTTFVPRCFTRKTRHKHLYQGTLCGRGANMAAKADFLRSIGGFDVVLGTGTPTMGGEDLAFFLHVIMQNKIVAYEPAAVVRHLHRRDYETLRKQLSGHAAGFTAYLIHMLLRYPVLWVDLLTKVPYDILCTRLARKAQKRSGTGEQRNVARLKSAGKSTNYPGALVALKFKGAFYGPIAYIKSRRVMRKNGGSKICR